MDSNLLSFHAYLGEIKQTHLGNRENPDDEQCQSYLVLHCSYNTVKPVLRGQSKIDKTKILMTELKKVESIAECSPLEHSVILLTCIK